MSNKFSVSPVFGLTESDPCCYVLTCGPTKILLDCGWNYEFDEKLIQNLVLLAPQIDLILISYADIEHIGALPYLIQRIGVRPSVPILGTQLTIRMSHLILYSSLHGMFKKFGDQFSVFDFDDVDKTIIKCTSLRYHQSFNFKRQQQLIMKSETDDDNDDDEIVVYSVSSGRLMGGSAWNILTSSGSCRILYCSDYDHQEGRIHGRFDFSAVARPVVLITDAAPYSIPSTRRKEKESLLLQSVSATLASGGSVLLPSQSSGRCLEILSLLSELNKSDGFVTVFLSPVARSIVDFAKYSLEWVKPDLIEKFQSNYQNPFDFANVVIATSIQDMDSQVRNLAAAKSSSSINSKTITTASAKRVIVTTESHLEYGFGRELLMRFGSDKYSAVILTDRPGLPCFATELAQSALSGSSSIFARFTVSKQVPLSESELEEFNRQRQQRRDENEKKKKMMMMTEKTRQSNNSNGDSSSSSSMIAALESKDANDTGTTSRRLIKRIESIYPSMSSSRSDVSYYYDDYGSIPPPEVYDIGQVIMDRMLKLKGNKGMALDANNNDDNDDGNKKGENAGNDDDSDMNTDGGDDLNESEEDADDDDDDDEIPTKTLQELVEMQFPCKILFIDLSGRSDKQSVRNISSKLAPKHAFVLRGHEENRIEFGEYLSRLGVNVMMMMNGDCNNSDNNDSCEITEQDSSRSVLINQSSMRMAAVCNPIEMKLPHSDCSIRLSRIRAVYVSQEAMTSMGLSSSSAASGTDDILELFPVKSKAERTRMRLERESLWREKQHERRQARRVARMRARLRVGMEEEFDEEIVSADAKTEHAEAVELVQGRLPEALFAVSVTSGSTDIKSMFRMLESDKIESELVVERSSSLTDVLSMDNAALFRNGKKFMYTETLPGSSHSTIVLESDLDESFIKTRRAVSKMFEFI